MPDPKKLKVGDEIRFVSFPKEWKEPGYRIDGWDVHFMERAIASNKRFTVYEIDEYGKPWIEAVVDEEEHTWAIFEETGWEFA